MKAISIHIFPYFFWRAFSALSPQRQQGTAVNAMPLSDMLQCAAVCCNVLQRVAVCCSVLQCVAV